MENTTITGMILELNPNYFAKDTKKQDELKQDELKQDDTKVLRSTKLPGWTKDYVLY